ncbi:MAG: pilin, partial [Lysobacteraceae bacterium]
SNASAGLPGATSIQGTYVSQVAISAAGMVQAHMGNKVNAAISSGILELSAITVAGGGSVQFKCKAASGIALRYLPTSCR